ncbi:hypothetical protein BH10PSE13_BH10PSE13_06310 [soil metagenome]
MASTSQMRNSRGRLTKVARIPFAMLARKLDWARGFARMQDHSFQNYEKLVDKLLRELPEDQAMARVAGCYSTEDFRISGDAQLAVLRHHGLQDGMTIYDVGCGSGRTASALYRSGWQGAYIGHDIVARLADYLSRTCPGYKAFGHRENSLLAKDSSVDIIFHWSVFTHLFIEECHNYMTDMHRALKPGGKLVFSFLETEDTNHVEQIFRPRLKAFRQRAALVHLDTFLHRGQIETIARDIGFGDVAFTDGMDATHHPAFWQSLVVMTKPLA